MIDLATNFTDLFTLRQHFFTGEYSDVIDISPEDYTGAAAVTALEYKLRALIITGDYSTATSLLSSSSPDDTFKSAFEAYIALAQGSDASSTFEQLITDSKDASIVQILGSFYLIKAGRTEEAIKLLSRHEESLEAVLLLVQLYLSQGKLDAAEKEVFQASAYSHDSIIYNLAEAYVNSAKNGENLRGSLYFFEELSHGHPTFKTLIGELVLNLQLHQWPEADEVLRKLGELQGTSADLVANEYAYANITGDHSVAKTKLEQLEELAPEHPTLVDFKQKNELFDSVVEKYKDQVVN